MTAKDQAERLLKLMGIDVDQSDESIRHQDLAASGIRLAMVRARDSCAKLAADLGAPEVSNAIRRHNTDVA